MTCARRVMNVNAGNWYILTYAKSTIHMVMADIILYKYPLCTE